MNNEEQDHEQSGLSRRGFLHGMGSAGALLGMTGMAAADDTPKDADGKVIPGFEKNKNDPNAAKGWQSVSDRKVRVGNLVAATGSSSSDKNLRIKFFQVREKNQRAHLH